MTLVIGSLQLGFLYGILALGIYVTFRILNIPDLTAEGSFTLGLAASAVSVMTMALFIILLVLEFRFVEKGVYYEN